MLLWTCQSLHGRNEIKLPNKESIFSIPLNCTAFFLELDSTHFSPCATWATTKTYSSRTQTQTQDKSKNPTNIR